MQTTATQIILICIAVALTALLWKPRHTKAKRILMTVYRQIADGSYIIINEETDYIMLKLKLGEVRTLSITPLDANSNATVFDGTPVWTSSNPDGVIVEPQANGYTAKITALQANSSVVVTVSGDGDNGDGVKEIVGTLDVSVQALDAVSVTINVLSEDVPVETKAATKSAARK